MEKLATESPKAFELDLQEDVKKSNKKWQRGLVAVVLMALLLATGAALIGFYWGKSEGTSTSGSGSSSGSAEEKNDAVMPDYSLDVTTFEDDKIGGVFEVPDLTSFYFSSSVTEDKKTVSFETEDASVTVADKLSNWRGFQVSSKRDELEFTLLRFDSENDISFVWSEDEDISARNQAEMEDLIESKVGESFVLLSIKLGSLVFIGSENDAVLSIHNWAQQLHKLFNNDAEIDSTAWIDMTPYITEVNMLLGAEAQESQEMSPARGSARSLLSDFDDCIAGPWCTYGLSNQCGNPCLGRCGSNCYCWYWVCWTCNCRNGCYHHDCYCSCYSFWSFWCLNPFWVYC